MKLQLTHKDLELALVKYLEGQGITAFSDLTKVHASFNKVRGSDELTVELDNDYTPPAPKVVEAKPATTPAASGGAAQAEPGTQAAAAPAETPAEAKPAAEQAPAAETGAAAASDDENLFD